MPVPRLRRVIPNAACCLWAVSSALAAASPGFGERWVADTSVPATLQTLSVDVPASLTSLGAFQYEIGFGTAEQPATGSLFDSLTISLARSDGSQSANIVTADVFGLTIIPLAPGGLLAGGAVSAQQIAPDTALLRVSATMFAYSINVNVSPALAGENLRSTFNFFNNGDAAPTVGYAAVVPEPKSTLLALAAGCVLMLSALRRRSGRTA